MIKKGRSFVKKTVKQRKEIREDAEQEAAVKDKMSCVIPDQYMQSLDSDITNKAQKKRKRELPHGSF